MNLAHTLTDVRRGRWPASRVKTTLRKGFTVRTC